MQIETGCPRYIKCSVNNCPLSTNYPNWETNINDPERKCKLPKVKRIELAKGSSLKYEGMTQNEYNGKIRWDNRPESEKEMIRQRASKIYANGKNNPSVGIDIGDKV